MNFIKSITKSTINQFTKPKQISVKLIDLRKTPNYPKENNSQCLYIFFHSKPKYLPHKINIVSSEITVSSPFKVLSISKHPTYSIYGRRTISYCLYLTFDIDGPFTMLIVSLNKYVS